MSTSAKVFTSRQAVIALLAGGAPDRVLAARASAVEKLRDDLALLVRWPALQASLETDAQALRAAMRCGRTPSDLDRQILESIRSTGTTNAARAEAQRVAAGRDWRKVLDLHTRRLRRRGLIRHAAGRWVVCRE